ncbi:lysozyme inhibitor LprI family protein [Rhizobium ruizarguesonis]
MKYLDPQQIIDWKERHGKPRRGSDLIFQVSELAKAWEARPQGETFIGDHVVVRLATILEVFVRSMVGQMVDSSEEVFAERARLLVKDLKLDFIFADSVEKQIFSPGDIVAHAISLSSVDAIMKVLTTLLPDAKEELRTSHRRWTEDEDRFPLEPIIADIDTTLRLLSEIFTARHILVHELSGERPYKGEDVAEFCSATAAFIEACDWVTVKHIEGTLPFTQSQMTIDAVQNLQVAEVEITGLLTQIRQIPGINLQLLDESQAAWEEFSKRDAALFASFAEGGTLHPMLTAEWRLALAEERAESLEELIQSREGL